MSENASDIEGRAEEAREQASGKLHDMAEAIRERGSQMPGGRRTTEYAEALGDRLKKGADYIGSRSTKDMASDLEQMVRRYPAPTLIAAAAVGFLVGRSLRS